MSEGCKSIYFRQVGWQNIINNCRSTWILPAIGKVFEKIMYEILFLFSTRTLFFFQRIFGFVVNEVLSGLLRKLQNKSSKGKLKHLGVFLFDLREASAPNDHEFFLTNSRNSMSEEFVWSGSKKIQRRASLCSDNCFTSGVAVPAGTRTARLNSWATTVLNLHQGSTRFLWISQLDFVCWRLET